MNTFKGLLAVVAVALIMGSAARAGSSTTSQAMLPVMQAVTTLAAYLQLIPSGATAKGAAVYGDGSGGVVVQGLPDGKVRVGNSASPGGADFVALPGAAGPFVLVPSAMSGGGEEFMALDTLAALPKRAKSDAICQVIGLAHAASLQGDVEVKANRACPGPVRVQADKLIDGQASFYFDPGDSAILTYDPVSDQLDRH